jgi:amino acid transporter
MEEKVFARRASGIIRNLGFFDTAYFSFLAAAGLYGIGIQLVWGPYMFPGANPWIAILLAAFFGLIAAVVYGMLSNAMPRSGGDYVFQSRTLTGALGFVTTGSNFVFWNMFYSYFAGITVLYGMVSPLLSYLGFITKNESLTQAGIWMTDPVTLALLTVVLIVVCTLVMYRGMMPFLRLQKYFMAPASFLALAIMLALLLSSPSFVSNFDLVAASVKPAPEAGWYANIVKTALSLAYNPYVEFNWWDTLGMAVMIGPVFIWPVVSTTLSGEIKGIESMKRSINMIIGGWAVTFASYLIAFGGMLQLMGMPFISSIGFLSFEHPDLVPLPAFIYLPLPGYMLISFLSLNPLIAFLIGLGFLGVVSQSLFNSPIIATRVMLAGSMDRVLPGAVSRVNKYGTPWTALLFVQSAAVLFALAVTALPGLAGFWTASALSGLVQYTLTLLGAALFPYTAKAIYEVAPCSKYKIGKIPVISVLGALCFVWALVVTYITILLPGFGLRGLPLAFVITVFAFLFAYYYIAKWYRAREGINLELAFKEVPPA